MFTRGLGGVVVVSEEKAKEALKSWRTLAREDSGLESFGKEAIQALRQALRVFGGHIWHQSTMAIASLCSTPKICRSDGMAESVVICKAKA